MSRALRVTLLLAGLASGATAEELANPKAIETEVLAIRNEFNGIERTIKNKQLLVSRFSIGGGQNQSEFEVAYQGGGEEDFEADPYATPFKARKIRCQRALPATGDASVSFYFDRDGKLLFAFASGSDLSGMKGFSLGPTEAIRVYYRQQEPFRVVVSLEKDKTVDLPLTKDAKMAQDARLAGQTLLARALSLKQALEVLAH